MRFGFSWVLFFVGLGQVWAQFSPSAGQAGTTAISKDSSVFISWATGCTVTRGPQNITNVSQGNATVGDNTSAIGMAGTNGVVSLGDGGNAILTFATPIANGPGWDFAVFENGFGSFLELAFVEVSSDGTNYFRFPATSLTQDTVQVGGFGSVDATKIDNLAGKYIANFGTPFDLQQLANQQGLNVNAITHVKVIDVVGTIDSAFATFDQFNNKVNDPWPTPFASSGFDLDAVGVIHHGVAGVKASELWANLQVYPNPANEAVFIQTERNGSNFKVYLRNQMGLETELKWRNTDETLHVLELSHLPDGIYFLTIEQNNNRFTQKLIIRHD